MTGLGVDCRLLGDPVEAAPGVWVGRGESDGDELAYVQVEDSACTVSAEELADLIDHLQGVYGQMVDRRGDDHVTLRDRLNYLISRYYGHAGQGNQALIDNLGSLLLATAECNTVLAREIKHYAAAEQQARDEVKELTAGILKINNRLGVALAQSQAWKARFYQLESRSLL